ncbi:hypothetical protein GJ496_000503 [Pomphorhynchus laevis]|nr:hypothetical protein GJ496_000503 [Pomphorhynchus laevis]
MEPPPNVIDHHPARFDDISVEDIKASAMRTHGTAGPSDTNAQLWKMILCSFEQSSDRLAAALAEFAIMLATRDIPTGSQMLSQQ